MKTNSNRKNAGFTIVEIIITFAVAVVIIASLYISISNLRSKQEIASYKNSITTYRDLFLKDIGRDITIYKLNSIEKGSSDNEYIFHYKYNGYNYDKKLVLEKRDSSYDIPKNPDICNSNNPTKINDTIIYGDEKYPLPFLDSDLIRINGTCNKINSLKIESIEQINSTDPDWLKFSIKIYHPDFGYRYSINIVSPTFQ